VLLIDRTQTSQGRGQRPDRRFRETHRNIPVKTCVARVPCALLPETPAICADTDRRLFSGETSHLPVSILRRRSLAARKASIGRSSGLTKPQSLALPNNRDQLLHGPSADGWRRRQCHPHRRRPQPTPRPCLVENSFVSDPGSSMERSLYPSQAQIGLLTSDYDVWIVVEYRHN
jgi:hypothetical protein